MPGWLHPRLVEFHLATEPLSSRGPRGWAHAVADMDDVALTVCGRPIGALIEWDEVAFPDEPTEPAYCAVCAGGVAHDRGE